MPPERRQVPLALPPGPHKRLAAYRDTLSAELGRPVTFGEAVERAVDAAEKARAADLETRKDTQ